MLGNLLVTLAMSPALGLEITWSNNAEILTNALLAAPPPAGVTLGTATITPSNPNTNDASAFTRVSIWSAETRH